MPRSVLTRLAMLVVAAVFVLSAATVSGAGAAKPKHGGTLTVLVDAGVWNTLDPATDIDSGQDTYVMSSIYGQLFQLGAKGSIIPKMASGFKFTDKNMAVNIYLRKGIKFSDGTPFTAQAVAASIARVIGPGSVCTCVATFAPISSVQAIGPYTVQIQLKQLDSPVIYDFIDTAPNWTVDPSALATEGGQTFGSKPVGAGPFVLTSQEPSASIDLSANPRYYIKGEPYLSGLDFEVTSSDQSDFAAIQSGEAQVSAVTTTSVFQQAETTAGVKTYKFPATAPEFVRLDTLVPPFNNLLAREAVSYATNSKELISQLYANLYTPTEGYLTPAEFFYTPKVPGYLAYNPTKASQLVSQIPGGLSVTLDTTNNTSASITETEAIAAQWNAVGIKTTVSVQTAASSIALREDHSGWEAMDGGYLCGVDPSSCTAVNLASEGLFTGIHDPTLDGLLNQASLYVNPATRARVYLQMDEHLNKDAEMVWLYAKNGLLVTSSKVQGIARDVAEPTGLEDYDTVWLS